MVTWSSVHETSFIGLTLLKVFVRPYALLPYNIKKLPKAMKNGPFSFFGGHIYDMPVFCHNFFTFSTIYNPENIDVFSVIKTLGPITILLLCTYGNSNN